MRGLSKKKENFLNDHFAGLMGELCASIDEFRAFDLARIEVSVGASRSRSKNGVWAYVTPLRYVGGALYRKGQRRGVPGVYTYKLGDRDLEAEHAPLYLITVLVPRFFFLSFEERIETLVHELYHLHPEFRGDLRRFPKPHIHHGPTPAAYNARVKELVGEALARKPELADHALLKSAHEDFLKTKKRRVSRPTLRFVPRIFALLLALSALAPSHAWAASDDETDQRSWRWPWEDRYAGKPKKEKTPLSEEFDAFDERNSAAKNNPRFLVTPTEIVSLRTAPSEWSAQLQDVKPGTNFLAFSMDSSGEWVFLRSRKLQGWVPVDKLHVVGQLARPRIVGELQAGQTRGSATNLTSNTLVDGDPVFIPGQGDIGEEDLLNFNADLDTVVATNSGPLYEQPDPLSVRYASVQPGDKVLILKRGEKGDWAYVRLLLTGEEGWFPSEWLKISRGSRVKGAGSGGLVIDLDGAYGNSGRNYGLGLGAFFNLLGGATRSTSTSRLELGGFYQGFAGEQLIFKSAISDDTYNLTSRYTLLGAGVRLVGFSEGGFVGGGLEAAGTYQRTSASLDGLSDSVIAESGIQETLKPHVGVMVGARGLISVTSWMQLNALVRFNLASQSNLFWAGVGVSFRVF
ncbi:MAG: SH3 domain-containing protein [Bdellovibrionota bacterium]